MPIDPRIPLSIQPVDVVGQMAAQQKTRADAVTATQQAQLNQLTLHEKVQAAQDQFAIRKVMVESGGDWAVALPKLRAINPTAAMAVEKQLMEQQKTQSETQKAQIETSLKHLGMVSQVLQGADATTWPVVRSMVGAALGPEALKSLPEQFDPAAVHAIVSSGRSASEQLQSQRDALDAQTKAAQLPGIQADTTMKQQVAGAMQGGLTAEQRAVNARQDAVTAETGRHDRASEGIAAGNLAVAQHRETREASLGEGDLGINSDVRTTATGRRYIDLSKYKGKDYPAAQRQARAAGVYGASSAETDALQNIDTARENLALIQQNLGKLPTSATTRNFGGGLVNKAEAYLQLDPALASWGTWRTAAIQAMRALAGSKGLRINRSEIEASMENDIPGITDTQATAKEKMRRVEVMLKSQEHGIFGAAGQAAPSASAAPIKVGPYTVLVKP